MIAHSLPDIPAASDIDYTDADEVYAYHILIGKYYQLCGGLDTPAQNTPALRYLDTQTIYWLTAVEHQLIHGPIADVPDLLEAYNRLHLLCHRRPATAFDNAVRRNTVDRWLTGEKSLTDTQIMLLLWPLVDADYRHAEPRYREYCSHLRANWINELLRYGRFRNTPLAEAYQRLSHLLRQDLMAYVGSARQAKLKDKWADAYCVSDPTRLDTAALRAYIPFARTVSDLKRLPFEDSAAEYETADELADESAAESADELYCHLWTEYISRPDVHPFFRQALSLDLANFAMA